ncbi:uncharacterized protein LOC123706634 [Pieris brassicae]|uniref:uncharacterized protein LOC123706634 n=1 Tax=Pieris brassicae TaxID=7116 RepID=UPI001E65F422|nr:uncharacterized protein LOC123706634 [Pieris brassicae]
MTSTVILILIMFLNGIESKRKNKYQPLSVCKPNSYFFLGCNICRCDDEGVINQQFCTKRKCPSYTRRTYNVDGSCEAGNWYSSEPCQICYCIFKSKLICNSVANQDKLQLGKFDFSICGNNYLEAASELFPNHRKKKSVIKSVNNIVTTTTTPVPDLNTDEMLLNLLESQRKVNDNNLFYKINDKRESKHGLLEDELIKHPIDIDSIISHRYNNDDSSMGLGALSLRRGKVKLIDKEKCTPGESFARNCETCYCLQNGKLLCVQRNCGKTN